jgi:hypothetical protein
LAQSLRRSKSIAKISSTLSRINAARSSWDTSLGHLLCHPRARLQVRTSTNSASLEEPQTPTWHTWLSVAPMLIDPDLFVLADPLRLRATPCPLVRQLLELCRTTSSTTWLQHPCMIPGNSNNLQ